ncbi:unnamed protein product [Toxocara canis]|uniref:Uncharacterized protein n=1 Tax=Toxocara canis TaxID=6265 RepID=A0A183V8I6_TOXCA|nr:unnamed protein product [Toxocara canis]
MFEGRNGDTQPFGHTIEINSRHLDRPPKSTRECFQSAKDATSSEWRNQTSWHLQLEQIRHGTEFVDIDDVECVRENRNESSN